MNTTTSAVMTGAVVYGGRWAQGKPADIKVAIGTAGIAIILSLLAQTNAKLAQQFGLLILVGAAFVYLPTMVEKLGLNK
jgi:hypothetical protein